VTRVGKGFFEEKGDLAVATCDNNFHYAS
jgi:hypothetical protein